MSITTLDLSALDSVTGGCHKGQAPQNKTQTAQKPLNQDNNIAGLAPAAPSGSQQDTMQTLATLGLGVLDLLDKGELDPNLLLQGIEDAFGMSSSATPDAHAPAASADHPVMPGMIADPLHGAADPALAHADQNVLPGNSVQDHQTDALPHQSDSQAQTEQGHTPYTGAGTWHMFSK
jgi:hypothetical protein